MPDELTQIAARIQELREILDISPEDMARSLGLPVEDYLAHEHAEKDIPISLLYDIARKLGVEMTELLTGEAPRMATHSLVRAGEGAVIDRYPGYLFWDLSYNFQHRVMEPLLVKLDPSDTPAPVTHNGQEFNYVLEGRIEVTVGSRTMALSAGDCIYFDPTIPHGQRALDGPATFLTVIHA